MTVSINNYNSIDKTVLTAEIWSYGTKRQLCGQVSLAIDGEDTFQVCLIDSPHKIDMLCKKHNIEIVRDDRTGIEKYIDMRK